eukprot:NODE_7598_length_258_cov_106.315789_g6984_i0.p2 GENE.NODE_7598_length_258_cov_106.315789_g6984_i0~~NODE_7598_length_258_cov_106.315789_g6984_i0.p2  ORF type:complete len:62 (-),score=24.01 NODE_7598_length_258_cov_106.315789_g6984_i0:73-234(-)
MGDLVVDYRAKEILEKAPADTEKVSIAADGAWTVCQTCPVSPAKGDDDSGDWT